MSEIYNNTYSINKKQEKKAVNRFSDIQPSLCEEKHLENNTISVTGTLTKSMVKPISEKFKFMTEKIKKEL